MTSHPLGVDSSEHDLIIGSSFSKSSNTAFHSMRFDFKPASVDPSQPSVIEVNSTNNVTVTVPHIEQGVNKSQTHTVYKGNKRPVQKDCVLIIDHETGDITLEKLSFNIALKKTRAERPTPLGGPNQPQQRYVTSDIKKLKSQNKKVAKAKELKDKETEKNQKSASQEGTPTPSTASTPTPPPPMPIPSPVPATSQPSFDFGSDSGSDSEPSSAKLPKQQASSSSKHTGNTAADQKLSQSQNDYISTLSEDLLLSESSSSSDSD